MWGASTMKNNTLVVRPDKTCTETVLAFLQCAASYARSSSSLAKVSL